MDKALELSNKYKTLLNKYGVNTPLRLSHFFTQLKSESSLKLVSENLNYSAQGLLTIFKKYFTADQANQYARKPEKIANRVYANRMGNSNEQSGDGWKFRGRAYLQITGKDNYKALSKETGTDYVTNPDLLLTEADSLIASLWYWKRANLNKYADSDDLDSISDLINIGRITEKEGDANGFTERETNLNEMKKIFRA